MTNSAGKGLSRPNGAPGAFLPVRAVSRGFLRPTRRRFAEGVLGIAPSANQGIFEIEVRFT